MTSKAPVTKYELKTCGNSKYSTMALGTNTQRGWTWKKVEKEQGYTWKKMMQNENGWRVIDRPQKKQNTTHDENRS